MAFDKDNVKILSITHLVMAALFLILGIVDRYEVKTPYSYAVMPCWTSAFILLTSILGLLAANQGRRASATLINSVWSMSIACAVLCTVILFFYLPTLAAFAKIRAGLIDELDVDFTAEEDRQLAITVVVIIIAVVEMIVALGSAASCRGNDASCQTMQENMANHVSSQGGQMPVMMWQQPHGDQVPMAMTPQPVVAMPVSVGTYQ